MSHLRQRPRSRGQGTVEYIGLLLAVSSQVKGGGLVSQIEKGFTAAVQKVVGSADAVKR